VKWSLPLVVVRLDEVKIRVPLVTDHLRSNKSEEKQKIRHYWEYDTLAARNTTSLALGTEERIR
jgi:hypothetical protein